MSDVIYLATASRKCDNCTCTKAVHPEVMRRDPGRYFYVTTEECGRCGDLIEVDNSMLGSAPPAEDECMGCGTTEDLIVAEFQVPGAKPTTTRCCICEECVEKYREWGGDISGRDAQTKTPY